MSRFVIVANHGQEQTYVLSEVKKAIVASGRAFEQVEQVKLPVRDYTYILSDFGNAEYRQLVEAGCIVIGTCSLLLNLQDNNNGKLYQYTHNQAMQGVTVNCSGLAPDEKERLCQLVTWMGGSVSPVFNVACTHLVAGTHFSEKAKVARKRRDAVKVVSASWITDVWYRMQKATSACTAAEYGSHVGDISRHGLGIAVHHNVPLPLFAGAHVCVTNYGVTAREEAQRLVVSHGGVYSGTMSEACTHLLAGSPSGDKYSFAASANIPVVTIDWLRACVAEGRIVDERPYAEQVIIPTRSGFKLQQKLARELGVLVDSEASRPSKVSSKSLAPAGKSTAVRALGSRDISNMVRGEKRQSLGDVKHHTGVAGATLRPSGNDDHAGLEQGNRSPIRQAKKGRVLSPTKRRLSGVSREADASNHARPMLSKKSSRSRAHAPSMLDSDTEDKENAHTQQPKAVNTKAVFVKRRQPSLGGAMSNSREVKQEELRHVTEEEERLHKEEMDADDQHFQGCVFYFSGFEDPSRVMKLRQVIMSGGGTRVASLDDAVSHVVLGGFNASDLAAIADMPVKPHVVIPKWLIACYMHRDAIPVGRYGLDVSRDEYTTSTIRVKTGPEWIDDVEKPKSLFQQVMNSSPGGLPLTRTASADRLIDTKLESMTDQRRWSTGPRNSKMQQKKTIRL